MRYAVLENNIVVNVVESETALMDNWVLGEFASIGDSYIDGNFVPPTVEDVVEQPIEEPQSGVADGSN